MDASSNPGGGDQPPQQPPSPPGGSGISRNAFSPPDSSTQQSAPSQQQVPHQPPQPPQPPLQQSHPDTDKPLGCKNCKWTNRVCDGHTKPRGESCSPCVGEVKMVRGKLRKIGIKCVPASEKDEVQGVKRRAELGLPRLPLKVPGDARKSAQRQRDRQLAAEYRKAAKAGQPVPAQSQSSQASSSSQAQQSHNQQPTGQQVPGQPASAQPRRAFPLPAWLQPPQAQAQSQHPPPPPPPPQQPQPQQLQASPPVAGQAAFDTLPFTMSMAFGYAIGDHVRTAMLAINQGNSQQGNSNKRPRDESPGEDTSYSKLPKRSRHDQSVPPPPPPPQASRSQSRRNGANNQQDNTTRNGCGRDDRGRSRGRGRDRGLGGDDRGGRRRNESVDTGFSFLGAAGRRNAVQTPANPLPPSVSNLPRGPVPTPGAPPTPSAPNLSRGPVTTPGAPPPSVGDPHYRGDNSEDGGPIQ